MKNFITSAAIYFLFLSIIYCQSEWIVYKPTNSGLISISVTDLEVDQTGNVWIGSSSGSLNKFSNGEWTDYSGSGLPGPAKNIALGTGSDVWIGTQNNGIARFDPANKTVKSAYSTSNSELPSNEISALIMDNSGRIWVGTNKGVAILDGTNWTLYNTSNSILPHNWIYAFAIDNDGNMWVGTAGGLAKSDGSGWMIYNTTNSDLPDNYVLSLAIDSNGDKWIGTLSGGLAKFSSSGWSIYNQLTSGLPANRVNCIVIDKEDNKWIGTTAGGAAKFDGSTWTIFNESNSQLPYNAVYALAIESNGNKWIGTYGGLAVYREAGVVSVKKNLNSLPEEFNLSQNYPNPFNPATIIEYQLPASANVTLKVYDVLGNEITTLVNRFQSSGNYTVTFANTEIELTSGVYFYTLQAGDFRDTKKMLLLR